MLWPAKGTKWPSGVRSRKEGRGRERSEEEGRGKEGICPFPPTLSPGSAGAVEKWRSTVKKLSGAGNRARPLSICFQCLCITHVNNSGLPPAS